MVRLLDALPPPPSRARPAPSFAGAALALDGLTAAPPTARSLFSSTLSQLSSLAASASCLAASAGPDAGGAAVVQIWPVVAVAGGPYVGSAGAAPSLSLSLGPGGSGSKEYAGGRSRDGGPYPAGLDRQAAGGGGRQGTGRAGETPQGGAGGPAAELRLRPATVWLSLPLLQRVEAFLAPLALAQARAALLRCAPGVPPS